MNLSHSSSSAAAEARRRAFSLGKKAWAAAQANPAEAFGPVELEVIAGKIPPDLCGCFYQNGPGRLERNGQRVGHWFDGDGGILAVRIEGGKARGRYRYVQTAGYQAEEKAGRYCFKNYGMLAPGPWPLRMLPPFKNAANTSVLALGDRLLALWEGGLPHRLDLETLETLGLETLGLEPFDPLRSRETYSAHPKIDPHSGEIFNFGVEPGPRTKLNLYRSNAAGQLLQRASFPLSGVPLIHDMALAGPYLVVLIPPVRLRLGPALLNLKSLSDSFAWQPHRGTEIWVFDRATLQRVSRSKAPAWFQWHISNGYVDPQGHLVIDLVRYPDFRTNEYLKTWPLGWVGEDAGGQFWRLRLDPATAQLQAEHLLFDQPCEFPVVAPSQVGQLAKEVLFVTHRPGGQVPGEIAGAIARFQPDTQTLRLLDFGPNAYPFAPVYAETGGGTSYVFVLMFDGTLQRTELWILNLETWGDPPACRLAIPTVVPFGFHGTWAKFG